MAKRSLNGFSIPWLVFSWDKNTTSKEYFENLLFYLASKRILVNPREMEIKEQCIDSVLEIKRILTQLPVEIKFSKEERLLLRNMVQACNLYLDTVNKTNLPRLLYKDENRWENAVFDKAMKNLRFSFRDTITEIESRYNLHFENVIPDEY